MRLETLRMFCELAKAGSFTRTAQLNGLSQSALSQTLTSLEDTLQSRLIERSKKRLRLTAEGQVLYDYSQRILQLSQALDDTFRWIRNDVAGTLRVATIYSIGLHELPPYIRRFLSRWPAVHIRVEFRPAHKVYDEVRESAADLGLVAYPERSADLRVVPFRKDRLVVICHPAHPLAQRKRIRLQALGDQKFVAFGPGIPTRRAVDGILQAHGVTPRTAMEIDNIETVKRAVEIDAGVSMVPRRTVSQELAAQTLRALEIADGVFERPLGIIYRANKVLSPAMREFLALLREGN